MPASRDLMLTLPTVLPRDDALRLGVTQKQLRGRSLELLSRGLYRRRNVPADLIETCRGLAAVLPPDAAFSHQTAARLLGLPDVGAGRDDLHVTVPRLGSTPRRRGVVGHESMLAATDVMMVGGVMVTTPARTFLDHAARVSREDQIVLGDAILHRRLATRDELAAGLIPGRRGVRTARAAMPLLDGRAESPPESRLRIRIHFSDLPDAEPQTKVYDATGRLVARVDLGYAEWRIGIEYEGLHHAEDPDQFGFDIGRYTELESLGWHILRAGKKDLRNESVIFLGRLGRLIAARQE